MNKTISRALGISFFCLVFAFNIEIINDTHGQKIIQVVTNECHATPVNPEYKYCQVGTRTSIGDIGSVTALWCGNCRVQGVFTMGTGVCGSWNPANPE